ncbi:MAG: glycosyltransferase family 2 protein [Polyangiaceae bacterium]|nr:glycosyltransferase family 2 protein [Polyangiaceae bacterium]
MSSRPFVTVVIPCLNEESHIERCVRDALHQDYPADRLEVIVADGGSTDRTRAILTGMAAEDPRMRWVANPGRIQAHGMNIALREARGDVLIRLDAHAEYAHDYVARCVEVLERTGADNVGGAQRARATTPFQKSLCAALDSVLGVGGAAYRSADREGFVDTVFNGAFRREILERVGLYDPGAVTNEDAELNQRILAAGGRIYLSRSIVAFYHPRRSYGALARQYFRYGLGRARTLLKHRRLVTVRPLGPFVALLGGMGLLALAPKSPVTWTAYGSYVLLAGVEAARLCRRHEGARLCVVWAMFPVMHLSHAIGMSVGLVRYSFRPDWHEPERLAPRQDRA